MTINGHRSILESRLKRFISGNILLFNCIKLKGKTLSYKILFSGGKASGFKNITDHDTYDVDGTRLFRVRGVESGGSCTRYLSNISQKLEF